MGHISAWHRPVAWGPRSEPRRSGLTDTDFARAQRILPLLAGDWSVDQHEDYSGTVSLVITSTDDHEDAPAFALHLEDGMIQCGTVVHDRYQVLGHDLRIENAFRRIAAYLRGERSLAA